MAKASSEVLEMMRDDAKRPPPPDKLDKLRKGVADLRSMELERKDLEEKLARNGENIHRMKTVELVALFDQAKVDNVGIPAEGNLPPYTMEVGWHYKANLGSPDEPKVADYMAAIAYLKKHEPDIIKTSYTVSFGLREEKRRKQFEAILKKNKFDYSSSFGVPWNSLTAWVKEQIEVHKKSPPLKLLGATVERTAKLLGARATAPKQAAKEAKSTVKKGKR